MYELLGSVNVIGISLSNWKAASDKIQVKIAMYHERTMLDWLILDLSYRKGEEVE